MPILNCCKSFVFSGCSYGQEDAPAVGVSESRTNISFVTLVAVVAAIGGLLFGFDTAVISGAIGSTKVRFGLSQLEVGWAASCLIVGCTFGAAIAGGISDKLGRKKVLLFGGVFYFVGPLCTALSPTFTMYTMARLICGIGIGATATLAPLYTAEIAPARLRGTIRSA